jgi:hypothetical protein
VSVDRSEVAEDRAIVDRIVDGRTAVLLVGPAGTELLLATDGLPAGATDGTWVVLDLETEPPCVLRIDERLTDERFHGLSTRLDAIRRRRRGGRFDR